MYGINDFYRGKRVFITGHTGFKGSWLSKILSVLGADISGYALEASDDMPLFNAADLSGSIRNFVGDIRDIDSLYKVFKDVSPEIVIHLAAQPIVREAYKNPAYTYETNVMGTVNILECIRRSDTVRSFVNVTTDKVYKNKEWCWGYRENDELDGSDPYSNSKSCSELVTNSYCRSFLSQRGVAVSTVRAGNVIGGGDFSSDRIIPDCVRAALKKEEIAVRNPLSVRPYQFVIEPLLGYLMIAKAQYENIGRSGSYNIGPRESGITTTGKLVDIFCSKWGGVTWNHLQENDTPHEDIMLKLDCSKINYVFGWVSIYDIETAVEKAVLVYKKMCCGEKVSQIMIEQIEEYLSLFQKD